MPNDDALDKFIEDMKNKPKPPARDPEFEAMEQKLYVRQLAERDALQKQQREETARLGASKQLEQQHDSEMKKLTQQFEKEREVFYRGQSSSMSDPYFTAKVQFTQDAEYKKLIHDLQVRQQREMNDMVDKQIKQRIETNKSNPPRQQLDANYERDLKARGDLSTKHGDEIYRYTREYHDAKVLREQLRENEKRQELEKGRTR